MLRVVSRYHVAGGEMQARSLERHIYMVAALLAATACGSGMLDVGHPQSTGGGGGGGASAGTAASYDGILADSARQGRINLSVNAAKVVTGTVTFPGLTVPVTGTVDTIAQLLHATGGGYTFSGQPFHGTIQGTYTGPAGTSTGYLIASSDSLTALTHTSYCGTYTSTNGSGWMSMLILSDGEVGGFAVQKVGLATSQSFVGTIANATTISATSNLSAPVNGTLSAGVITGTFSPPIGGTLGSGTFSMSLGSC